MVRMRVSLALRRARTGAPGVTTPVDSMMAELRRPARSLRRAPRYRPPRAGHPVTDGPSPWTDAVCEEAQAGGSVTVFPRNGGHKDWAGRRPDPAVRKNE